jgi:hypothetical protein
MTYSAYLSPHGSAARSQLTKLLQSRPMLRAGLVSMARTCGKPSCKCAKGEKHVSLYVSLRVGRTRKMIYVPPELEPTVRSWAESYREAAALWETMLQEYLQRLLKDKAGRQRSGSTRRRGAAANARPV